MAGEAAQSINTDDAFRKLSWLENQLFLLDLPESVPKGICHCDFHYSNVLFKGDKLVGLIDFDDANFTYLMFDLVCLMDREWPRHAIRLDFELARPIAKEYMSWRRPSEIEQGHTFDIHKLCILFDCIWFFERGLSDNFHEKKKIEFLNNLGRAEYTTRLFFA